MARRGKPACCLTRVSRSSITALTILPSTTNAAVTFLSSAEIPRIVVMRRSFGQRAILPALSVRHHVSVRGEGGRGHSVVLDEVATGLHDALGNPVGVR